MIHGADSDNLITKKYYRLNTLEMSVVLRNKIYEPDKMR